MSDIFSFDTQATQPLADEAKANSISNFDELDAPRFRGAARGLGLGIMRGGARTADFMQTMGAFFDEPGTDKEALDTFANQVREDTIDYWTPTPQEIGKVGQVLGGFGEIVLPLAAAGGNPSLLMGTTAIESGKDLVNAGVSAPTAVTVGTTQALATGLGFKIPVLGNTLTSRLATGAAGNVAFGAASRATESALLNAGGRPDLAPPIMDLTSVSTDALTGLLFGGLHHTLSPRINPKLSPPEVDAVLAARNAKSFQTETAPGAPDGTASEVGHQSALEAALEQVSHGEPVNVGDPVAAHEGTNFEAATNVLESGKLARQVAAGQPTDVPYASDTITQRFEANLGADHAAAVERYSALPDSASGKILNVDTARELSPDYLADRTQSAAVHEPASAFIKKLYAEKLAEAPKAGEEPLVVFSAGGTGAGKTTGLAALPGLVDRAQVVYDTNMNRLESSVQKIEQALAAGKRVEVLYTYRDPLEALTGGALPRAMRQERQFGSGRTVPLNEHLATHEGSRSTVEALASRYAGDPRVNITAVDNSRGPRAARVTPLDQLPKPAYTQLREQAAQALDAERQAGRISQAIHRGFAATDEPRGVLEAAGAGRRGQSQPSDAGRLAETTPPAEVSALPLAEALKAQPETPSELPELAALQQLAHEQPDAAIYSGYGADGNPVQSTLADASERIQQEYAADLNTAKAYEAAVQCFLGHGA